MKTYWKGSCKNWRKRDLHLHISGKAVPYIKQIAKNYNTFRINLYPPCQQSRPDMESSWNEEEVWRVEMYVSFGIMSFGLMSLLAVTSIPSISSTLNWREFSFIQVNTTSKTIFKHSTVERRLWPNGPKGLVYACSVKLVTKFFYLKVKPRGPTWRWNLKDLPEGILPN